VRIRCNPHPGVLGLAPSAELRQRAAEREAELAERDGFALPPEPSDAVPTEESLAAQGLRTIPPRETGGNIDIKQISPGTTVLLPVYAEGGLVSTGDVHFAQGDCEACGTALEMRSRVHLRFGVRKGEAERQGIRDLQFFRDDYFTRPEMAVPRRFYATTGISLRKDGQNESEDLTLAARNALMNMIEHLGTRGFDQPAGLCALQRGGGPSHKPDSRRAEPIGERTAPLGHLYVASGRLPRSVARMVGIARRSRVMAAGGRRA
jgi:formamidase